MRIKKNTRVVTADNQEVGRVERVVIDPATRDLSHLIISRGWLFKEDRVLPFEYIAHATEDEIRLSATKDALEPLPEFTDTAYVTAQDAEPGYATPYFFYPVGLSMVPTPAVPLGIDRPAVRPQANIPEESVALKEGAGVVSADQEHVGAIEQVVLDANTNRATHFVVVSGLLNKEHRLIPHVWVKDVRENEVHLYVNAEVVRRLRTQEEPAR